MVLTLYTYTDAGISRFYRAPSPDKVDAASIANTLKVGAEEAKEIAKFIRDQDNAPVMNDKYIYAADKNAADALYGNWKAKKVAPPPPEGGETKTQDQIFDEESQKLSASDLSFSNALSFAIKNRAINLSAVRSGFRQFKKWHETTEEGRGLIRNFIALGIAAVARRKEDFATALLTNLQALGDVPIVFAGAGGTFKAWLYFGYDILLHWRFAQEADYAAAPYMQTVMDNVDRIIPRGDVRDSVDRETGGNNKVAERNRALAAARQEFKAHWKLDDDLTVDYIHRVTGRTVIEKADSRKGTITAFVKKA